jgi:hypothetical protein
MRWQGGKSIGISLFQQEARIWIFPIGIERRLLFFGLMAGLDVGPR